MRTKLISAKGSILPLGETTRFPAKCAELPNLKFEGVLMKKVVFGLIALFLIILVRVITSISYVFATRIEGEKWQPLKKKVLLWRSG